MGSSSSILHSHRPTSHPQKRYSLAKTHEKILSNRDISISTIQNPPKKLKSLKIELTIPKLFKFNSNISVRTTTDLSKPPENNYWSSWKQFLLPEYHLKSYYTSYLSIQLPQKAEYEIRKDLTRTFPIEKFNQFLPEDQICDCQDKLFRVIKAVTLHFSNVGYCQGMNFLAGFMLLMNGGDESEAFCFFVRLSMNSKFFLIHLYEDKFPLLYFLIFVFNKVAKEKIPEIFRFLKETEFPEEAWLIKWYLSLFLNGFPMDQAIKFWDFLLGKDVFAVVSLTVSLIRNLKKLFYKKEKADFMKMINSLNENQFVNVEICIKEARKIEIKKRMIGRYAEEFVRINPNFRKSFCMMYFLSYAKNKIVKISGKKKK